MDGYSTERHSSHTGVSNIRPEQWDPEANALEKKMLKLIVFGGCLMAFGFLIAIMGVSGLGGIIVILLGAFVVAIAVIIAYRANRVYSTLSSGDRNQPPLHFPSEPSTYQGVHDVRSTSPLNNIEQPMYNNQQQAPPISQALFIPSPTVSHGTGIDPSAPPVNVIQNDNPPSYDELFSNK